MVFRVSCWVSEFFRTLDPGLVSFDGEGEGDGCSLTAPRLRVGLPCCEFGRAAWGAGGRAASRRQWSGLLPGLFACAPFFC